VASQKGAQSLTALPAGLGASNLGATAAGGGSGSGEVGGGLGGGGGVKFAVLRKGKQGRMDATRSVLVPEETGLAAAFAAGQAARAAEKAHTKNLVLRYAREADEREAEEEDMRRRLAGQRWSLTGGGKGGNFNANAGGGKGGKGNRSMVIQDLDGGRGSVYATLPLRPIKQRAIPTQPPPSYGD